MEEQKDMVEAWNSMGFKVANQENNMENKNNLQKKIENRLRREYEEYVTFERDS